MTHHSVRPLAAGAAVLLLGACSVANSGSGSPAAPDTVRIVLPQEPPTLEPCDASLTSTGVVVRSNITEPLAERDPATGELLPLLATAWEQDAPTSWTFHLRPGVTFSDGTPFDAQAAAFSIQRTLDSDVSCDVEGYVFGDVDLGTRVVDPLTLVVTTPEPDPILPLRLSFVEVVPTSTDTTAKVREPVGTGPYRVERWDAGQRLVLTRNDTYWGAAPAYREAEYEWRSEGSVRAAMVVGGEAEIATSIGPEDGAGATEVDYRNNETTAIRMQLAEPPLDDPRVRRAVDLAVDRAGLAEVLYGNGAEPAAQLVPEGIVGFNADLRPAPYDPAQAAELLAQARADGVDLDVPIRLIARTGLFPMVEETTQVIQQELSDLGLDVSIRMVDTVQSIEYQQRPFPEDPGPYLLVIQHGNQAGDAAFSVDQYLLSQGQQSSGGSPELDERVRAAEALSGRDRQDALAQVFADEPDLVGQFAYIAHMTGAIARSDRVDYEPTSATGDEMHLAAMRPTGR
ncbi:ABC transporter substrate-binding protein [Kineococcus sp. SYSU DK002]|uniref:ABC transporter substrate-binding protein n=1 Tax=Kineococcus sp. SYSU DK002 TaxID=3383123 RepID=UPI003D7C41A2